MRRATGDYSVIRHAKSLLGQSLIRIYSGSRLAGKIVEVEAYHQDEPASHTYRGKTERNQAMFGPNGHAYIYFTYGNHYCFNVTAGQEGEGAGILVRALEPIEGIEQMIKNRFPKLSKEVLAHDPIPDSILRNLCNGPGKLTQALKIDKSLYGHNLSMPPLYIEPGESIPARQIVSSGRIGIKQAANIPWRFYTKGSSYISRK